MRKNIAVVLGGTKPHSELIRRLKQRGYFTILVDYLENPIARADADLHLRESTLDLERVVEVAREHGASLVISACIDQANATACYAAERLGLPHPYNYETAVNVTNKGIMKRIFKRNQIPTADFFTLSNLEELKVHALPYPVVVKPVDCNSSKGVKRVDRESELADVVKEALELSRSREAIIERFNRGTEIQVDCFVQDGKAQVVMTREKQKLSAEEGSELQSFGSFFPASLSWYLEEQIEQIAGQIARGFALERTPFFFQAIIRGNEISVLEFAPRIGGGISFDVIQRLTGFDMMEALIRSFLQEPVDAVFHRSMGVHSSNLIYMLPGRFDHVEGIRGLLEDGVIEHFYSMASRGAEIDAKLVSGNRVAGVFMSGRSKEELAGKWVYVLDNIKVVDASGNDLLNRRIYESLYVKGDKVI